MISLFAEPLPIKCGQFGGTELLLLGVLEDDYGLRGLAVDRQGEMAVQRLEWPIKCDWRFDAEKDAWFQLEAEPTIPTSTADEEMTQRPANWPRTEE
jgi:hypothetical protein